MERVLFRGEYVRDIRSVAEVNSDRAAELFHQLPTCHTDNGFISLAVKRQGRGCTMTQMRFQVSDQPVDLMNSGHGAPVVIIRTWALWFPGLVHGLLILESRVQTVRGRWFLSWPATVTAA